MKGWMGVGKETEYLTDWTTIEGQAMRRRSQRIEDEAEENGQKGLRPGTIG